MTNLRKFAASSAMAAVAVTSLMPAATLAAPINHQPVQAHHSDGPVVEEATEYRRRYRRWRRHRRNRVDAGDVIAGIGILAGIAIIADAASKSEKRNRNRSQDRYEYPEQRRSNQYRGNDVGTAVSLCSDAAERSAGDNIRIGEIRSATRDGEGWRVSGSLSDNRNFQCGARNGTVDFIQLSDESANF